MAVTKARKAIKRSTPATADSGAGASSSLSMAPPPGPIGANELKQPPLLPPGVYFNPTKADRMGFLNRWITGDDKMPDARGFILHADMYDNDPYRPDRRVEQSKEELREEGGRKNCFGFYYVPPPPSKKLKTPWLMKEFTSDRDRGDGRRGVPALHKLYVTPRAEGLREIYGEDGLTAGNKKPVPADYFAAAAALMPPGSVRGLRQEHVEPSQVSDLPPSPPPLPHYGGDDDDDDDDGQNFMDGIMSSMGPLHYDDSEKGENSMGAANVLDQYQQQHDEDAPEDNFSIPMDQFMRILDKPAETEGEEPAWDSLSDIVDHDELVKFNKDA
ncbi:hypothetical protein VPH35_124619 [Triticum aestivum]